MLLSQSKKTAFNEASNTSGGFTLVELLVAMVIGAIVMGVIFATHNVQQRTFRQESMKLATMQKARSAMDYLERERRMAGYDRPNSGLFGLTSITPRNTITFTYDLGVGGNADNGVVDADETVSYFLYNSGLTPSNRNDDLGRTPPPPGTAEGLVAVGIEQIGFAYAFDSDNDGQLDWNDPTNPGVKDDNEGIFWAVDWDGDGQLDTNLDTNWDGDIDAADFPGAALPALPGGGNTVSVDRIRAVKIMVLARSRTQDLNYQDNKSYWLGVNPVTTIPGDGHHRRLLVSTVRLRNLGL